MLNPFNLDLIQQEISSADTSINGGKLPALFTRLLKEGTLKPGSLNLDLGGGRFDNVTEALEAVGVENVIFDPFNRTLEWNLWAAYEVRNGRADTVTISNVLNVILERGNRTLILRQAEAALKPGGRGFITVYEGNRTGAGEATSKGWQWNCRLALYLREVQEVFPNAQIERGMISFSKEVSE